MSADTYLSRQTVGLATIFFHSFRIFKFIFYLVAFNFANFVCSSTFSGFLFSLFPSGFFAIPSFHFSSFFSSAIHNIHVFTQCVGNCGFDQVLFQSFIFALLTLLSYCSCILLFISRYNGYVKFCFFKTDFCSCSYLNFQVSGISSMHFRSIHYHIFCHQIYFYPQNSDILFSRYPILDYLMICHFSLLCSHGNNNKLLLPWASFFAVFFPLQSRFFQIPYYSRTVSINCLLLYFTFCLFSFPGSSISQIFFCMPLPSNPDPLGKQVINHENKASDVQSFD